MSKKNDIPYESYHHKPIKRFYLDGIIHDDSMIGRLKEEYIRLLTSEMKLSGYVPRIDLDPDFTIGYNDIKNFLNLNYQYRQSTQGKGKANG
jgi:hypothetical protein